MKQSGFFRTRYFLSLSLFLVIFGLSGCTRVMSGGMDFNSLNIQEPTVLKTFESAKKNDKKVLLIFDAVWCGTCRKFNQTTMKDADVRKTLSDYEVLNIDVDKYPDVIDAFQEASKDKSLTGIPAILIFSSDGIQQDQLIGYKDAEKFDRMLKQNL